MLFLLLCLSSHSSQPGFKSNLFIQPEIIDHIASVGFTICKLYLTLSPWTLYLNKEELPRAVFRIRMMGKGRDVCYQ